MNWRQFRVTQLSSLLQLNEEYFFRIPRSAIRMTCIQKVMLSTQMIDSVYTASHKGLSHRSDTVSPSWQVDASRLWFVEFPSDRCFTQHDDADSRPELVLDVLSDHTTGCMTQPSHQCRVSLIQHQIQLFICVLLAELSGAYAL